MGQALAVAAIAQGHEVVIVSGPVTVEYPSDAKVIWIVSTEELLDAAREVFRDCDGMIAAAAPCDYRPMRVETNKIAKNGRPLELRLIETPDVAATLGAEKEDHQWTVGFALETEDQRFRALVKLENKNCDLIVLNGPEAMDAASNSVEVLDETGTVIAAFAGKKIEVSKGIMNVISQRLV
jgi:phosphopantothenoylcysteine decarboxylase/phosphopantothenate--cysteine ligase